MPDDPDDPPSWYGPNKGRSRKDFNDPEKPDFVEERVSPPVFPPPEKYPDRPELKHAPPYASRVQDNSGRDGRTVRPPKHTKEQIDTWEKFRRDKLRADQEAKRTSTNDRHTKERKFIISKNQRNAPGKDTIFLNQLIEKQKKETEKFENNFLHEEGQLNRDVALSREDGQIHDKDYVSELTRQQTRDEWHTAARGDNGPDHDIDGGRTSDRSGGNER